jgi:putative addiction module component (TIGR02574 family)
MAQELLNLPLAQRLELMQELWDSIAAEQAGPAAPAHERQLIDQRLEAFSVNAV